MVVVEMYRTTLLYNLPAYVPASWMARSFVLRAAYGGSTLCILALLQFSHIRCTLLICRLYA